MENAKSRPLNGSHNKRINSVDKNDNELTAAWANHGEIYQDTNVSAPSEDCLMHAKEWVDNGSKL